MIMYLVAFPILLQQLSAQYILHGFVFLQDPEIVRTNGHRSLSIVSNALCTAHLRWMSSKGSDKD